MAKDIYVKMGYFSSKNTILLYLQILGLFHSF